MTTASTIFQLPPTRAGVLITLDFYYFYSYTALSRRSVCQVNVKVNNVERKFQWLEDGTPRMVTTLFAADFRESEPKYLWQLFESNGSVIDSRVWIVAPGAEEPIHMDFEQLLTLYPHVSVIADELQRRLESGDPKCCVRARLQANGITLDLGPRHNRRCYRFSFLSCNNCRVDQPGRLFDSSEQEDEETKWKHILTGTWDEGLEALSKALSDQDLLA